MSETIEWRWVDVDGKQAVVGFHELSALFSSESLPPFALVWRPGWPTWLAAANVPELLPAIGAERAGPPTSLRPDTTVTSPPSPPLERYRGVTQKTLLGLAKAKPQPTVPPPPPPPRPRARSLEPPAPPNRMGMPSLPPPVPFPSAPIPVRDVQPTLAGEELPPRSQTLRPAGALPPPPRSYPQSALPNFQNAPSQDAEDDADEVEPYGDDDDEPTKLVSDAPEPRAAPRSVPPPMPVSARTKASEPASASPVTASDAPPRDRRKMVTRVTALSLLIPGVALILAAVFWPKKKPDAEAAAAAAPTHVVTLPPQTATLPTGCTLTDPARKLEASAFASVPLLSARAADGKALIGFASSKEQALGVTIDPTSLEVTHTFEQTVNDSTTLGVVPLVGGGATAFAVDRAEKTFAFSRTVDAEKRFAIGVAPDGFGRRVGTDVTMIWPGKSDDPTITTPRVAHLPSGGYAVAFRHGGQEGKVLVGYIDADGGKSTDLKAVGLDVALVGTPSVAANDKKTLVAFAAKKSAGDPWFAELAAADNGALPESNTPFTVPAGGPGGEVISPAAEALSSGRFLLQWTEGSAGNRAVRVQVLGSDLAPIGDPITLSNQDQNAGQGALWVSGERALALFLVKNESANELWGAGLKCP